MTLATWKERLLQPARQEWLTPPLFQAAVNWLLDHHQGQGRVPELSVLLKACEALEPRHLPAADTAPAAQDNGPVSATQPPKGVPREFWNRNVAIGKARARNRFRLIDEYRVAQGWGRGQYGGIPEWVWKGKIEPTEAEIAVCLAEVEAAQRGEGVQTPRERAAAAVAAMADDPEREAREAALLAQWPHLRRVR